MGLPPSLVQAARNHQQLTVVQAQPTPPQTPVSTITWKSAAVAPAAAAVIVPEPQKVTTDPRAVVNNVIRTNERQYSQVNECPLPFACNTRESGDGKGFAV